MGQKPAKPPGPAAQAPAKPRKPRKGAKGYARPGQPAYRPSEQSRKQVLTLVGLGIREDEIAGFIDPPCSPTTLRKHYRVELDKGLLQAKVQTLGTLHRLANGAPAQYYPAGHPNAGQVMYPAVTPDRACLIFKCKVAYGMRETIRIGGDRDEGAKPISIKIEDLSDEQLDQLLHRLDGRDPESDQG